MAKGPFSSGKSTMPVTGMKKPVKMSPSFRPGDQVYMSVTAADKHKSMSFVTRKDMPMPSGVLDMNKGTGE